ncbi:hypothetical protein ZIOFF_037122 [Zingiber officinale]|uniref:BHLH domain-containing protein n=1 Tax=Zingiber officinale TaxID=94328 RepID=A0A8J5L8V0_ZINOF|nr:hypothetical protein ZIOFF_037122 [Zingiber officinale]
MSPRGLPVIVFLQFALMICMARSVAMKRRRISRSSGMVKKPLQRAVLRKMRRLKELVPGCCRNTAIGFEELLRTTAQYVTFLELKIIILKRTIDLRGGFNKSN